MEYSKETKEALRKFANDLYPILEWHTQIDCVASWKDAEKVRKKYAPNSLEWVYLEEDIVK